MVKLSVGCFYLRYVAKQRFLNRTDTREQMNIIDAKASARNKYR